MTNNPLLFFKRQLSFSGEDSLFPFLRSTAETAPTALANNFNWSISQFRFVFNLLIGWFHLFLL